MGNSTREQGQPIGTVAEEGEWQFDAADLRSVRDWMEENIPQNGLSSEPGEVRLLTDTYFDTADWRLYRAGYALRLRERGKSVEATMKSLEGNGPEIRRRREVTEPLGSGAVEEVRKAPGLVGERVRFLIGRRVLKPLFVVHTRRTAYAMSFDGEGVGEVALDETEFPLENDAEPVTLQRVEFEVRSESTPGIEGFVENLKVDCGLTPAVSSKYEAGLRIWELEPPGPPELGPTGMDASGSAGEAAFAVMREQFGVFLSHEGGARIGENPEELHDMRVAGRRLRAAASIFDDALPAKTGDLLEELRYFAGIPGEVRDFDVQIGQLESWITRADPEDREPLAELISLLGERREKARRRMLRAFDTGRYRRFVEEFAEFLRQGPSRRQAARRSLVAFAPEQVRLRYRKIRKAGDGISARSPAEDYHKLRKRSRRLRYALEFLSGVYGKPATKLIQPLKDLQDVLGGHQDAVVGASRLRDLREHGSLDSSPQMFFIMGSIHHRYETLASERRGRFPKVYDEVTGKRWKKLDRTMRKSAS